MRRLSASLLAGFALAGCAGGGSDAGNGAVYAAWQAHSSRVEVTASGSVARMLRVQRGGQFGPHEGFLLHLTGAPGHGLTVKVEDNLDLTGPIPIHAGDAVVVRGEYEYNALGGVVHWTHHDPRGHHAAGYIQVGGRTYE
ncbi:MAG: DUF3465 domain-containing protein [Vulcanimicrobiaceae bacterium]